jgi:hypothetical protein
LRESDETIPEFNNPLYNEIKILNMEKNDAPIIKDETRFYVEPQLTQMRIQKSMDHQYTISDIGQATDIDKYCSKRIVSILMNDHYIKQDQNAFRIYFHEALVECRTLEMKKN